MFTITVVHCLPWLPSINIGRVEVKHFIIPSLSSPSPVLFLTKMKIKKIYKKVFWLMQRPCIWEALPCKILARWWFHEWSSFFTTTMLMKAWINIGFMKHTVTLVCPHLGNIWQLIIPFLGRKCCMFLKNGKSKMLQINLPAPSCWLLLADLALHLLQLSSLAHYDGPKVSVWSVQWFCVFWPDRTSLKHLLAWIDTWCDLEW